MKCSTPQSLSRALNQRLTHNEAYLAQSLRSRTEASRLSYGAAMSTQWLIGEEAAIRAENEWIRATLRMDAKAANAPLIADEIPVSELNHHD